MQLAVEEKKASYRKYLQNNRLLHRIQKTPSDSKENDRKAKKRGLRQICKTLERDITGTQRRGFKIFKQLPLQERYKLKIDLITKIGMKRIL
jgi:hypothetical protein